MFEKRRADNGYSRVIVHCSGRKDSTDFKSIEVSMKTSMLNPGYLTKDINEKLMVYRTKDNSRIRYLAFEETPHNQRSRSPLPQQIH